MAELSVWLFTVAVGDLAIGAAASWLRRGLATLIALAATIVAGWLVGVPWLWCALIAAGASLWLLMRTAPSRVCVAIGLVVFLGLTVCLALFSTPPSPEAPLGFVSGLTGSAVSQRDPALLMMLLVCGLAMVSTGNGLVRAGLLLADEDGLALPDADTLRAGRIIGTLERLLILGFAFAGQLTAAALVISAKGLLRFRELDEKRHSEYVLVGSLLSWTVALSAAALIAFTDISPG